MLATSLPGRVLGARLFFIFFLQRHGGGLRLARSSLWAIPTSLPMADPCSHDVTLHIPTSARSRGIPHTSQRALFPWHSCCEIPVDDVTRAPNLCGFPCRPARAHRPGNPLHAFRKQNTRHAACGAPQRAHVGTCVFRIHPVVAILAVPATVFSETQDVHVPAS